MIVAYGKMLECYIRHRSVDIRKSTLRLCTRGSFCTNCCISAARHGGSQPVAPLRCDGSFDSSRQIRPLPLEILRGEKEISISGKRRHEVPLKPPSPGGWWNTNSSGWRGDTNHHWLWKRLGFRVSPPLPLGFKVLLSRSRMLLMPSPVQGRLVAHFLDTSWCSASSLSPLCVRASLEIHLFPTTLSPTPSRLSMNWSWYSTRRTASPSWRGCRSKVSSLSLFIVMRYSFLDYYELKAIIVRVRAKLNLKQDESFTIWIELEEKKKKTFSQYYFFFHFKM